MGKWNPYVYYFDEYVIFQVENWDPLVFGKCQITNSRFFDI